MSAFQSREDQADSMMSRFLHTLQEISIVLQRQGQENSSSQENNTRVMQSVGTTLENLAKNSAQNSNLNMPSAAAKVIDLVEFSGADRSLWPSWQIQARGKAESCGPDPNVQFFAVFNKLKDNAAKNVTPWVTRNISTNTATYEGLLKELGRLYDDPAQEAKALNNLKSMKQQERESFATFFPKFEKELANAGSSSIGDQIKIMFLRSALSTRFRNCLPKTKHYETYEELVIDLQNAAATMANEDALLIRRDFGQNQLRASQPTAQINDTIPMDWTPTRNNQSKINNDSNKRPRAQWVSKETLKARQDSNCCLRCGNRTHYQPNCPYRPPINPNRPVNNFQGKFVNIDPALLMAEPDLLGVGELNSFGEANKKSSLSENE